MFPVAQLHMIKSCDKERNPDNVPCFVWHLYNKYLLCNVNVRVVQIQRSAVRLLFYQGPFFVPCSYLQLLLFYYYKIVLLQNCGAYICAA